MDIKNFKICENAFAKRKHRAIPRMVFSKDVIRFNAPAIRVILDMGMSRADVFIDADNKQIALVGCKDGGLKLQETGVRMLREMDKFLDGVIKFEGKSGERISWGNNWGYSRQEYECTKVVEIDKKNKAIVFDLSECQKIE